MSVVIFRISTLFIGAMFGVLEEQRQIVPVCLLRKATLHKQSSVFLTTMTNAMRRKQ
jgi:hypothetical protein